LHGEEAAAKKDCNEEPDPSSLGKSLAGGEGFRVRTARGLPKKKPPVTERLIYSDLNF